MKINFIIFLITAFLVANTYYDGKFTDYIVKGKKYYKMATFAFIGLSMYIFINKNPQQSHNLVKNATDFIKYMPMDSNTSDLLTPLFDFTNAQDKMSHFPTTKRPSKYDLNIKNDAILVELAQKDVLVKLKRNMLLHHNHGNVLLVLNNLNIPFK